MTAPHAPFASVYRPSLDGFHNHQSNAPRYFACHEMQLLHNKTKLSSWRPWQLEFWQEMSSLTNTDFQLTRQQGALRCFTHVLKYWLKVGSSNRPWLPHAVEAWLHPPSESRGRALARHPPALHKGTKSYCEVNKLQFYDEETIS
jgi:hypothetical protein